MVRSDLASVAKVIALDRDTGFRDVVVIIGSYGLGESVVGDKSDPDEVILMIWWPMFASGVVAVCQDFLPTGRVFEISSGTSQNI